MERSAADGWRTAVASLGPVRSAVVLALVSAVPVAWSLEMSPPAWMLLNEGFVAGPIDWRPAGPVAALVLAAFTVIPAALLSSWIGGRVGRRHQTWGLAVTLWTAWATGVVVLPVAAAALGVHLRTGIACAMGCEANLRDDVFLSGVAAYGMLVVVSTSLFVFLVIPLGLLVLARATGQFTLAVAGVISLHAVLHLWILTSVSHGGFIPYLSLLVGFTVWCYWMRPRTRSPGLAARGEPLIDEWP
jgi:hypothetical protein